MPLDENNASTRMNRDNTSDVLTTLVGQLNDNIRSFTSEMKDLKKVLGDFKKDYTTNSKEFNKTSKMSFSRSKDSGWNSSSYDIKKNADIEKVIFSQRQKLSKLEQELEEERITKEKEYVDYQEKANLEYAWRIKQEENASRVRIENIKNSNKIQEEQNKELEQELENHKNRIKDISDDMNQQFDSFSRDYQDSCDKIDETSKNIKKSLADLNTVGKIDSIVDIVKKVSSNSPYLSLHDTTDKKSEAQQFQEFKDQQLSLLKDAISSLESFLKDFGDTLDEKTKTEKEAQLKYLKKQEKLTDSWTYTKEILTQAGKNLADAGKTIANTFAKNILKVVEDRYLSSYKEGFSNVYNSVESTRNTVSARLKMDQGGFTDLQNEIHEEIVSQGLEATVSQVDVNNAIAELSAAGVTDKEMLKTLALEQAKLAASGSSLNLGNEETLSNIRQFVTQQMAAGASQQDAIKSLQEIFSSYQNVEDFYAGTGWTTPFVNGGGNTLFNATMNRGIMSQWTAEQISSDIISSGAVSDALSQIGLDYNLANAITDKLTNMSIEEQGAYLKAMFNAGIIDADTYKTGNLSQVEILKTMQDYLRQFSGGDTRYLTEVINALGMSDLNTSEAIKLMQANLEIAIPTEEELAVAQENRDAALQTGKYVSKTSQVQTETQNSMAKLASEAEKYYKGDSVVLAGFNAVETGIGTLIDVGNDILSNMVSNGIKGLFSGGAGGAAGSAAGSGGASTLIGSLGSTATLSAGTVGLGALAFAGGAAIGYNIPVIGGKDLKERIEDAVDPFEQAAEDFKTMTIDAIDEEKDKISYENEKLSKYYKMLKKNNIDEMRLALLQEKNIETGAESEEEIQKLFMENLIKEAENNKTQAELQQQMRNTLLEHSTDVSATAKDYANMAFYQTGKSWEDMTQKERSDFIEKNKNQFAGSLRSDTIKDIGQQMEDVMSKTGSELDLYLMQQGVSDQELSHMTQEQKQKKAAEKYVLSYGASAGFEDESQALFEYTMSEYNKRKSIYEKANEDFKSQWDKAVENAGENANLSQIMLAYAKMYHENNQSDFLKDNNIVLDESNQTAYLDPGDIYKYSYKFRTGLDSVPYDDYPALLHKGERILTAEEAEAYNEMSSYAVSNLISQNRYGNSSNVYNTNSYGLTGFETSIDDQTKSLSSILNQILSILRVLVSSSGTSGTMSAAHRNVLMRNSNVTQLNTLM